MSKLPNIVLLVADDHGRETMGCYGNPQARTPHLDSLSADSVTFSNAFCTSASCAASRSVILTGLYNHANGTYGHTHAQHHFSLFQGITTLPACLNLAGYRTGRIGKTHYAPLEQYPFQVNLPGANRDDVAMSENCRGFIAESSSPFFLYWCSLNPHRSAEHHLHEGLKINHFGNPAQDFPGDRESRFTPAEIAVPPFLNDDLPTRLELAQYYQSIARLDRGIGRLLAILRQYDKYEDTVIIYVSDNGAAFPCAKTTLYEPGIRLPCLLKKPGQVDAGSRCENLISWVDIMPTLLDFAATAPPGELHGHSFRDTSPAAARAEVFASHTFHEVTNYYPMRAIRTSRYKFIWNIAHPLTYSFASDLWNSAVWQQARNARSQHLGKRSLEDYLHHPRFELFDLEVDPDELHNLAEEPEYQKMIHEFCSKMQDFQQRTNDPWRHKWEYE
ncbi:MAG: sulfatase [Oligosphaeraceae bacterium]|nr:sulfatase [Oligosphaeraceae bacterium]